MSATDPDNIAALDAKTDRLRQQLESKPSLIDVLSPPASQPPDAATTADRTLRSTARIGTVYSWFIFALGTALAFISFGEGRSMWIALAPPLMLVALIGINAFTAIHLLRKRIVALESELHRLQVQVNARPNPESTGHR